MGGPKGSEKRAQRKAARRELQQKKAAAKEQKKRQKQGEIDGEEVPIEVLLRQLEEEERQRQINKSQIVQCKQPTPRAHASLTALPSGDLLLFGGESYDGKKVRVYGDLFKFDIEKDEWKRIEAPESPKARCSHQAVLHSDALYVFGGEFSTYYQFHHFKDFWRFDIKANTWKKILVESSAQAPSPRSGHRVGDFVFLHGGFAKIRDTHKRVQGKTFTDSWLLDLRPLSKSFSSQIPTWEKIKNSGAPPSPRTGMCSIGYKSSVIVFGGVADQDDGGTNLSSTFFNDLYSFDITKRQGTPTIATNPNAMRYNISFEAIRICVHKPAKGRAPGERRKEKEKSALCSSVEASRVEEEGNGNSESDKDSSEDEDNWEARSAKDVTAVVSSPLCAVSVARYWPWAVNLAEDALAHPSTTVQVGVLSVERHIPVKLKDFMGDSDSALDADFSSPHDKKQPQTLPEPDLLSCSLSSSNSTNTTASAAVAAPATVGSQGGNPDGTSSVASHNQQGPEVTLCACSTSVKAVRTPTAAPTTEPAASSPLSTTIAPSSAKQKPLALYSGDVPLPRLHGLLTVRGSNLVLMGGIVEIGSKEITLDDCWTLNLNKRDRWVRVLEGTMHQQEWLGADSERDSSGDEGSNSVSGGDSSDTSSSEEDEEEASSNSDDEATHGLEKRRGRMGRVREEMHRLREQFGLDDPMETPAEGEALRDFFGRTKMYWLHKASATGGAGCNSKELTRAAFELASRRFFAIREVLERMEQLVKQDAAHTEAENAGGGPKGKQSSSAPGASRPFLLRTRITLARPSSREHKKGNNAARKYVTPHGPTMQMHSLDSLWILALCIHRKALAAAAKLWTSRL
ncbi:kelch domain-containing protein 4 [Cyclospora cayetanensis]|uniref:Kelch domain-containing protein 4 n=1 Tax=Cyclospora cayetanensis TaxID=88456 RepID=A0A6P6RZU0_9EIME|nr:kelch domain-containing protein 4 [Cyclospora cayetanensis]